MPRLHHPHYTTSARRLFPSASFVGCADVWIDAVTERSDDCRPGTVFAAIPGTRVDGTDYVADAVRRGASAILTERPLADVGVPQCIIPNARSAYARLCSALHGDPSRRLAVVGVTGTNGKTTVTWLVRSILRNAGLGCGLLGTIESDDGRHVEESRLTTPDSAALAEWLGRMVANGTRHAAIELSSHALHQDRAAGTRLAVGVVTNVTRDHFDYHGGFDDYVAAKARLAELLEPRSVLVVNADDPGANALAQLAGVRTVTFGIDQSADVRGEVLEATLDGTHCRITAGGTSVEARLPFVGRHNVSNALAATASCLRLAVDLPAIRDGLEAARVVPGRLERVPLDAPYDVLVDYAHTPDALGRVLESLRPLCEGRLICVFGAGGDRDREKRPEMGRAAAAANVAIVTSDNPRTECPERIIDDVLAGMPGDATATPIVDRRSAIEHALSIAEPGDCVLVAGKGHERDQTIGTTRLPFDDRVVVTECHRESAPLAEAVA